MNQASILIIDDEASLRSTTAILLQQQGYAVTCAASGEEGWEMCQRVCPDLVLLDVRLAGTDGRDLCRKIKSDPALQRVFVILISGALLTPEDEISGFEAGGDSYLHRPISNGVLLAHISALLRIRRREIALDERDRALDDARTVTLNIMQDVEIQRKRAEEARLKLEESMQSLRMLSRAIEDSPVSIIIVDCEGMIEYINPHFTRTTGYAFEEVVGQHTRIRRSDRHPSSFYTEIWNTLLSGEMWRGEICNRKKNGELHWESAAISPVRNSTEEITHFVAIFEDITDRKQLDAELRQAKDAADAANRAKSTFLAKMSHEIRTPMNAILGYSQLLQRDSSLSAAATESVRIINRSGEHLLNLINDVLEMSKIEAGRMSLAAAAFDLPALISDLSSMFRLRTEAKGLAFETIYQGEVPTRIIADEGKLRQVLMNLLGNAIKFTAQGTVTLRISASNQSLEGAILAMEVEDTGVGIAADEIGKLFSTFEQTASGRSLHTGTGLGLAISRDYARLMGGDITVSSQWKKGSVFRIEIPVQISPEGPERQTALLRRVVSLNPDQEPVRILVVDHEPDNRSWLAKLLASVGFEVREAVEGLQAIREWQAWSPHVILMGVNLPGMNGCDVTRNIRALPGGNQPCIFAVTAGVFDEAREAALSAGFNAFLPKPVKESELFDKIQQALCIEYLYAYEEPDGESEYGVIKRQQPRTVLPENLLKAMRSAIQNGDMERLRYFIRQVAEHDEPFSQLLGSLADQYEFDAMFRLLTGENK